MKISILIIPLLLSFGFIHARILNGYKPALTSSLMSLQKLNSLLAEDKNMSETQRRKIKTGIESLLDFISCYQLTDELLYQLQRISPGIFRELDTIKDKLGRSTDVYVKFIRKKNSKIQLNAMSFFDQNSSDDHKNVSEYGDFSVSVEIFIGDNALLMLAHELGHVSYVVPNLASYVTFYNKFYRGPNVAEANVGHVRQDPSGESAYIFENRFLKDKAVYYKNGGIRMNSVLTLMKRIKKDNRKTDGGNTSIATIYPPEKGLPEDFLSPR